MPDDIFIDPPCALWPVGVDSPPERITIWPELPVSLVPDTNDNDPPFPATLDAPAFIRMLPVKLIHCMKELEKLNNHWIVHVCK